MRISVKVSLHIAKTTTFWKLIWFFFGLKSVLSLSLVEDFCCWSFFYFLFWKSLLFWSLILGEKYFYFSKTEIKKKLSNNFSLNFAYIFFSIDPSLKNKTLRTYKIYFDAKFALIPITKFNPLFWPFNTWLALKEIKFEVYTFVRMKFSILSPPKNNKKLLPPWFKKFYLVSKRLKWLESLRIPFQSSDVPKISNHFSHLGLPAIGLFDSWDFASGDARLLRHPRPPVRQRPPQRRHGPLSENGPRWRLQVRNNKIKMKSRSD